MGLQTRVPNLTIRVETGFYEKRSLSPVLRHSPRGAPPPPLTVSGRSDRTTGGTKYKLKLT